MHYLYILEGRLKYETISFDSEVVFNLYNKNTEKKAQTDDDALVYFLKSDVDVVITVNLASNQILLSAPLSKTILLFDQAGTHREIDSEREINLTEDTVKFRIADTDFSFLINTKADPERDKISAHADKNVSGSGHSRFSLTALTFAPLKVVIPVAFIVVFLVITTVLNFTKESDEESPFSLVFNTESEMMRADLQQFDFSKILIKTHLMEQVKLYFEQQGLSYVKFDLEKQDSGKFNLMLYVFQDENENYDAIVNQYKWIASVIVQEIDIRNMLDDYNRIAAKYGLRTFSRDQSEMLHQLIEVSFVNNNLKFESLQRDLHSFYERWGRNYIEFNVSLKQHRELPIDFILKGSGEELIKSDQGFYIN